MTITPWHVPVDDTRHYWYAIFTSFGAPVDKDEMRASGSSSTNCPTTCRAKNKSNDYGFDPHEQAHGPSPAWAPTSTCTTNGLRVVAPSRNRTREHLGQSDKAIKRYRRLLRNAIEEAEHGGKLPMVLDAASAASITGPAASTASARRRTGRPMAQDRRAPPQGVELGERPLSGK